MSDVQATGSPDASANQGPMPIAVGDVVATKYRVEAILGRGGMGLVMSAKHLQLEERVAIKFLLPVAAFNPELRERFLREARVSAKLRCENVAHVVDIGMLDNGSPYMVMEYLSGSDLRRILMEQGPFPVAKAVEYIVQACLGVAEAHSYGVIHRDLKSSNLFLTRRPDGSELIKVLDFGISKALGMEEASQDLTTTGVTLGSPRYMSPEQLSNSTSVDFRSDVWSLATILYELLAGDVPFAGQSPARTCALVLGERPARPLTTKRSDVSPALEKAIFRALERNRAERTPNVAAFADDIVQATKDVSDPLLELCVQRIYAMLSECILRVTADCPQGLPIRPRSSFRPWLFKCSVD